MSEQQLAAVLAAEANGVLRLYNMGALSARETVQECDRLLAQSCPSDAVAKLRELRASANRKLH